MEWFVAIIRLTACLSSTRLNSQGIKHFVWRSYEA